MISIQVTNKRQNQRFEHTGGPIEFGRGPKRKAERFIVNDLFASRDQLRLEEITGGKVRAENLSSKQEVGVSDGTSITVGTQREFDLPVRLVVGQTYVDIEAVTDDQFDQRSLATVEGPVSESTDTTRILRPLDDLGESPAPESLAHWLETVIQLQRSVAGTPDYYDQTARALVQLVGLDQGLLLLRRDWNWDVAGKYPDNLGSKPNFSRTLLTHVVAERRTFYQDLKKWHAQPESLRGIEAAVLSPIFGANDEVLGVLYGIRTRISSRVTGIRPLEAQIVQLLAAAVGANLSRSLATRNQLQFEQFFPADVARDLENDLGLLDGRLQEVTLMSARIDRYPAIAEKLGAQQACRLARDVLERLTERVLEHRGVVVEYHDAGLLAVWNAPIAQPDHALLAAGTALGMTDSLPDLSAKWQAAIGAPLALGIGMHLGSAQVGSMGSTHRFKYGVFGPAVKMVHQLQGATKSLGRGILITGPLQNQLPDTLATRRLCQARFCGHAEPLPIYELHGVAGTPEWTTFRDAYEAALMQFEFGQWGRACQSLLPLIQKAERQDTYDPATLVLTRIACDCLQKAPANFDPVLDLEKL
jgi:adenylate cyclase